MAKKKRDTTRGKQAVVVQKQEIDQEQAIEIVRKQVAKHTPTIKDLPKAGREAVAHGLRGLDYSIRRIEQVMGVDKSTVMRYLNTELDDHHLLFADTIKKMMFENNAELNVLASKAMRVKLKDTDNQSLRDIVGAYKVINDVAGVQRSSATNTGNVMTINVHPAMTRDDPIVISHNERDE